MCIFQSTKNHLALYHEVTNSEKIVLSHHIRSHRHEYDYEQKSMNFIYSMFYNRLLFNLYTFKQDSDHRSSHSNHSLHRNEIRKQSDVHSFRRRNNFKKWMKYIHCYERNHLRKFRDEYICLKRTQWTNEKHTAHEVKNYKDWSKTINIFIIMNHSNSWLHHESHFINKTFTKNIVRNDYWSETQFNSFRAIWNKNIFRQ